MQSMFEQLRVRFPSLVMSMANRYKTQINMGSLLLILLYHGGKHMWIYLELISNEFSYS